MQVLNPHANSFRLSFEFLQADLPTLPEREPALWHAFLTHSSLSDRDARAAVSVTGGPPLLFAQNLNEVIWAQFDPEVPDRIELSRDVLQQFERDSSNPAAKEFLRAKVLHEMCHWGCFRRRVPDPDTAGEAFEAEVFGAEKRPWWQSAVAGAAALNAAGVDPRVFSDPAVRAEALLAQLPRAGHLPGRADDPLHKVFGGIDVAEGIPRGYRNNNPGNIRVSTAAWNGLAEPDKMTPFQRIEKSFCVFREPEWGMRAMIVILRKYQSRGFDTPRKIISRWAPTSDGNDVESYTGHLAAALGVTGDDVVDAGREDQIIAMVRAMATHENGSKPLYADVQFAAALRLS